MKFRKKNLGDLLNLIVKNSPNVLKTALKMIVLKNDFNTSLNIFKTVVDDVLDFFDEKPIAPEDRDVILWIILQKSIYFRTC